MEFLPFEPGIEVNGQTVYSIVDGFSVAKNVPTRILAEFHIGTLDKKGEYHIDRDGWYSQAAWLDAFKKIAKEVGPSVLYGIGLKIPENAIFPPFVKDVETAVQSIDIAYHLNHRKAGKVMFDMAHGTMQEGIGHDGYQKVDGRREIVSVCENPYPCVFDHGIIATMAKRFEARSSVIHDDARPCRQRGDQSCTYIVRW